MEVEIVSKMIFMVECFGDNGSWFDIVMADNEKIAANKCYLIYSKYHKKFNKYLNSTTIILANHLYAPQILLKYQQTKI